MIKLCTELCLSSQCIYTSSNEQLLADGCQANSATAQLSVPSGTAPHPSTPPSTSSKSLNSTATPDETGTAVSGVYSTNDLRIEAQPHVMLQVMLGHVKIRRTPPLHPLTLQLFDTIEEYEKLARETDFSFESPIWRDQNCAPGKKRTPCKQKEWGDYAVKQQSKGGSAARKR